MMSDPETLFDALHILAGVHTRDDDRVGFVVEMSGPHAYLRPFTKDQYIKAWEIVRAQLHLKTKGD